MRGWGGVGGKEAASGRPGVGGGALLGKASVFSRWRGIFSGLLIDSTES